MINDTASISKSKGSKTHSVLKPTPSCKKSHLKALTIPSPKTEADSKQGTPKHKQDDNWLYRYNFHHVPASQLLILVPFPSIFASFCTLCTRQ